jgi:hypothetical protein
MELRGSGPTGVCRIVWRLPLGLLLETQVRRRRLHSEVLARSERYKRPVLRWLHAMRRRGRADLPSAASHSGRPRLAPDSCATPGHPPLSAAWADGHQAFCLPVANPRPASARCLRAPSAATMRWRVCHGGAIMATCLHTSQAVFGLRQCVWTDGPCSSKHHVPRVPMTAAAHPGSLTRGGPKLPPARHRLSGDACHGNERGF